MLQTIEDRIHIILLYRREWNAKKKKKNGEYDKRNKSRMETRQTLLEISRDSDQITQLYFILFRCQRRITVGICLLFHLHRKQQWKHFNLVCHASSGSIQRAWKALHQERVCILRKRISHYLTPYFPHLMKHSFALKHINVLTLK